MCGHAAADTNGGESMFRGVGWVGVMFMLRNCTRTLLHLVHGCLLPGEVHTRNLQLHASGVVDEMQLQQQRPMAVSGGRQGEGLSHSLELTPVGCCSLCIGIGTDVLVCTYCDAADAKRCEGILKTGERDEAYTGSCMHILPVHWRMGA